MGDTISYQKIVFGKDFRSGIREKYFPEPNVLIGPNSLIKAGTTIFRNTVIGENVKVGSGCFIGNNCLIRNDVVIFDRVKIGFSNSIEPHAIIENDTTTQGFCMVAEYSCIGQKCFLGPHFNSTADETIGKPKGKYEPNPPIIKSHCRFGSGTRITPGIKVARGTITGAMSLLTKDTEENCLYVGVPAKKVRKLTKDLNIR